MTVPTRIPLFVLSGVVAALSLAACSSSGSSGSPGGSTSGNSAAPPASVAPSGATAAPPAASGTTLHVTETEFHIALGSTSLHAGTYTLDVKNAGSITHALTVDGPGIEDKSTGDLSGGASGTLTVTLKPGTYEFYCPVGNHKMEGMDEKVTVA